MGKLNIQCFTCENAEICKYKDRYTEAIGVLDKTVEIRNIPWLNLKLECRYERKNAFQKERSNGSE